MAFLQIISRERVWFKSCSVLSYFSNLCFKFLNFTTKLFHLLGFTKELVFCSSSFAARLHLFVCFSDGSCYFKEPAWIACGAFEAFWRGCILLESEMISFKNVFTFLSLILKSANEEQWHFTSPHYWSGNLFWPISIYFSCLFSILFSILLLCLRILRKPTVFDFINCISFYIIA